jgi:hypothetical protein
MTPAEMLPAVRVTRKYLELLDGMQAGRLSAGDYGLALAELETEWHAAGADAVGTATAWVALAACDEAAQATGLDRRAVINVVCDAVEQANNREHSE